MPFGWRFWIWRSVSFCLGGIANGLVVIKIFIDVDVRMRAIADPFGLG